MPKVLTTGHDVLCGHGGIASLSSTAKLTVSGDKVLLANEASTWTFTASPTAPAICGQGSSGGTSCTAVVSLTAGQATKLTVAGQAVVLDGIAGQTNGAPDSTNLTNVPPTSKLEAV